MASEQELLPLLNQVRENETGLSNNIQVQTTLRLLPEHASWKLLISPAGCVQWADRVVKEFLVHLQQQQEIFEIPVFDACPPMGISIGFQQRQLAGDIVWPAATIQALADYIKKCGAL